MHLHAVAGPMGVSCETTRGARAEQFHSPLPAHHPSATLLPPQVVPTKAVRVFQGEHDAETGGRVDTFVLSYHGRRSLARAACSCDARGGCVGNGPLTDLCCPVSPALPYLVCPQATLLLRALFCRTCWTSLQVRALQQ